MTEYRKHATFEPGTVCFYLDDEDSWRIVRIDEVQGEDPKRMFAVQVSLQLYQVSSLNPSNKVPQ